MGHDHWPHWLQVSEASDLLTVNRVAGYTVRLMSKDLPDLIDPLRAVAQAQHYSGRLCVSALARVQSLIAPPPIVDSSIVDSSMMDKRSELIYSLRFARDDAHRAVVHVEVRGELSLVCQRCLSVMKWPVVEQSVLALVQGFDEAAALPDDYDPLMPALMPNGIPDGFLLRPLELIEDEVLLAIPAIARHPHCDLPNSHASCTDQIPFSQEDSHQTSASALPDGFWAEDGLAADRRAGLDNPDNSDCSTSLARPPSNASPFAVLADWKVKRR